MTTTLFKDQYGYWGEHPDHPVNEWAQEASNNETRLGYWDWVEARAEGEEFESGEIFQ